MPTGDVDDQGDTRGTRHGLPPRRPEVLGLLAESKDRSEEDGPRLILADYLEERGDPRGTFVRLQVQAARLDEDDPQRAECQRQAEELSRPHLRDWLGPLVKLGEVEWSWARGLITLYLKGRDLLRHEWADWAQTEAWAWVECVRMVDLTDSEAADLCRLPPLHLLSLNSCERLTDAGLAHLRNLTSLQRLDLSECVQLTDAGLAHLNGLTTLRHLDLRKCGWLTDAGLAHLRHVTSLQHLDLGWCERLTDAGLAHLSGLTALRYLTL